MQLRFHAEFKGLMETIRPMLKQYVGSDRILRLRKAFAAVGQRIKYYLRQYLRKHFRSGLLYKAAGYRVRYYRKNDAISVFVGIMSKRTIQYRGREQVSHKYAHFLITGHKAFTQLLRQPPFAKRNPNGKPMYPRHVGAQRGFDFRPQLVQVSRNAVIAAAQKAIEKVG